MSAPVMLMILDGWGWREEESDNAVRLAHTPHFDALWVQSPHAFLNASGGDVGLPDGQMGNSEVGHLNLGAGRIVFQDLPRINQAIEDGQIAARLDETGLIDALKKTGGTCHLFGLVSPGGVHAHQNHVVALAQILARENIPTALHIFTDGRDTPPFSARDYIIALQRELPGNVKIATLCGRYFAMDRDKRWDRVSQAFEAMVHGRGEGFDSALAAIDAAYAAGKSDEFLPPAIIGDYQAMRSGDGLLSFNFRSDRIRELLETLLEPSFSGFERGTVPQFAGAVGMTSYGTKLDALMSTLFPPQKLANGLGETVSKAGKRQLRAAETEKYPHVTYFFNGGLEEAFPGEDRLLVQSPKVATYDLQPEMSAPELTDRMLEAINSGNYDLIVLNFANPDMVGHTGSLEAAIKAVETVDGALGRIAEAVRAQGGAMLVTADHGNCELMRDPATGIPHTAHTTNKVPVLLLGGDGRTLSDGRLADIAPTLLALMGLPQPADMTGRSLLRTV